MFGLFIAFFFAIFKAFLLISTAVISLFSIYLASDTAIAPLPVQRSNILGLVSLLVISITSSTNILVHQFVLLLIR